MDNLKIKIRDTITKVNLNLKAVYTTIENNEIIDLSVIAGETIGGHKVVYIFDSKAYLADLNNIDCLNRVLGISLHASNIGGTLNIRKFGLLSNPNWNLTPNANYFLGENGALSLTSDGMVYQNMGFALDGDNFLIDMKLPIKRD